MTMRELGPYLLLRKLSEDALSETYRAGQRSGEDVERVVLLYTLKSDAEAAHWLADTATVGHRALKGLNSHTIATVVDSGEIDGAAYLAYDYISGIRLNQLFRESRDKGIPLPMDLALLIADRLAQGLLDAWEHESRMLHGFLVPHLVMISTEGDARVLGIEVAGRLRRLLTEKEIHDEVRPYLGPEVVPESQASTIDDVYSLGALLFELTTGTQPPPATFDDVENAIAEATTADGSEIPADVRSLLESSLAKSMRRIDLKTWHSELNDLIVSGQYEASPFSLALFLHQLFGDTLDEADGSGSRDSSEDSDAKLAELEAQVTALQELERQLAEPDTTDGSADADEHQTINPEDPILGDLPEPDGPSDELSSDEFFADVSDSVAAKLPTPVPKPASRGRGLKMAAAAALVLLAVGIGYFALRQEPISADSGPVARQEAEQSAPEEIVRTTAPEAADPAEVTTTEAKADLPAVTPSPPKPTPSRSTPVRARGPSQKDSSATASQRTKLSGDSAEKAPVEEATNSGSRIAEAADTGSRDTSPSGVATESLTPAAYGVPSTAPDTEPTSFDRRSEQPLVASAALNKFLGSTEAKPLAPDSEPVTETPPPIASQQTPSVSRKTVDPTPDKTRPVTEQKAKPAQQPAKKAPQPAVQTGQLVSPGPGVTPPRLKKSIQPAYPMMARRLNKKAAVSLRILIDEAGQVLEIEPLGEPAGYGFDEAAVRAVESTRWDPPTKNGVFVKMWWTIRVEFQP